MELTPSGQPPAGYVAPLHAPVLANIYLHYVLDRWIENVVGENSKGEVIFMRYADDIIVCFERKDDAERYHHNLSGRLAKFSLSLSEEKTGLVKFNRWESDSSGKFTFLGYDFYWARTKRDREHKMVKRRTNKKKYRAALAKMKEWIKEARNWPLKMILSSLRLKLRGYWNYYSVIGNSSATWKYYSAVKMLIYKWLNRRSQRKSYRWEKFKELFMCSWDIPAPRTVEQREDLAKQQALDLAKG